MASTFPSLTGYVEVTNGTTLPIITLPTNALPGNSTCVVIDALVVTQRQTTPATGAVAIVIQVSGAQGEIYNFRMAGTPAAASIHTFTFAWPQGFRISGTTKGSPYGSVNTMYENAAGSSISAGLAACTGSILVNYHIENGA